MRLFRKKLSAIRRTIGTSYLFVPMRIGIHNCYELPEADTILINSAGHITFFISFAAFPFITAFWLPSIIARTLVMHQP